MRVTNPQRQVQAAEVSLFEIDSCLFLNYSNVDVLEGAQKPFKDHVGAHAKRARQRACAAL